MWLRVFVALIFSTHGLCGQEGDKPGETQVPLVPKEKIPPAPALSPEQALNSFQLQPGFRIELVAAEPLVQDPVQLVFDPAGRLWVLEMRGFMPNIDGTGELEKVGSVAVLEDTDGDGRCDKKTLIANDYAIEGDPRHGPRANVEHTANGLLWAIDNWIYSANYSTRFRNTEGTWRREPTAFRGQWGISQDDFGRLVYNSNSDPLRIDLVPSAYLERNAHWREAAGRNVQPLKDQSVWPIRVNP